MTPEQFQELLEAIASSSSSISDTLEVALTLQMDLFMFGLFAILAFCFWYYVFKR